MSSGDVRPELGHRTPRRPDRFPGRFRTIFTVTGTDVSSLDGRGRLLPSTSDGPARITFDDAEFTLAVGAETRVVPYRDLATVAVQAGTVLLALGSGPGAERFLLSGFGAGLTGLLRELRERRLRQQLADALVEAPDDPIEMLEYTAGGGAERGVALLAYHPWGVVLAPLDERLAWLRPRRGDLASVDVDETGGSVAVMAAGVEPRMASLTLPGLGERARLHGDRLAALRRGAQEDAARLVSRLMPDADYGVRQEAVRALVDGRPARPADLPGAWPAVEAAVLTEPQFAASYAALVARAGPLAPERAIALAPQSPGGDEARSWFFVPLPGNLVALELVSEGAHATYCFRAAPRATAVDGAMPVDAVGAAIRDVTGSLLDTRFLREPIALPDEQLRLPANLRYRLALRVLPSLAAARARFVARIVHRDDVSWAAALDDLIAWHGSTRDDAAVWPGRAAQESMVESMVTEAAAGEAQPQPAGGS